MLVHAGLDGHWPGAYAGDDTLAGTTPAGLGTKRGESLSANAGVASLKAAAGDGNLSVSGT